MTDFSLYHFETARKGSRLKEGRWPSEKRAPAGCRTVWVYDDADMHIYHLPTRVIIVDFKYWWRRMGYKITGTSGIYTVKKEY